PDLNPVYIYKLPAIVSDIITAGIIYKVIKKKSREKLALVGSALYLFNPAIFANSANWGQVDSLTGLFTLSSIFVFNKSIVFSAILLAIGASFKPQAALAVFALGFMLLQTTNGNIFKRIFNKITLQRTL